MKVAVASSQHSPMVVQRASSQTLCRFRAHSHTREPRRPNPYPMATTHPVTGTLTLQLVTVTPAPHWHLARPGMISLSRRLPPLPNCRLSTEPITTPPSVSREGTHTSGP